MEARPLLKAIIPFLVLPTAVYYFTARSVGHQYQSQLQSLQAEIQLKDRRIAELELKISPPRAVSIRSVIQVRGVTPLDLQNALKRAGYYDGPFDGRLTDNVVGALKGFQKKNGLRADGVLGKKTWALLKD